jgi:hypothetical protein
VSVSYVAVFAARETYVVENDKLVGPAALVVADGEEDTVPGDRGDQLLGEEGQQDTADGREVEVVHLEQEVELERLASAHQLPTAKDDDVVCDERSGARLERRERRLAGDEAEVLGLVASNGLEDLLEDGPQGDAEGAVKRGRADLEPFWLTHCVWLKALRDVGLWGEARGKRDATSRGELNKDGAAAAEGVTKKREGPRWSVGGGAVQTRVLMWFANTF